MREGQVGEQTATFKSWARTSIIQVLTTIHDPAEVEDRLFDVIRAPVSQGYPSFQSDMEKEISIRSPRVLEQLISRIADPGFRNLAILGCLCTQSPLVREAVVAFDVYGQDTEHGQPAVRALQSYQSCVSRLRRSAINERTEPVCAMTAILFLGLLEGLRLGDPGMCLAHFEATRLLLRSQLTTALAVPRDSDYLKLYRIAAECVIFNFATVLPFYESIDSNAGLRLAWDDLSGLEQIFYEDGVDGYDTANTSPFLGGFHRVYLLMFKLNVLLRRMYGLIQDEETAYECAMMALELQEELYQLEPSIFESSYNQPRGTAIVRSYKVKHAVSVYAMRVYLTKLMNPHFGAGQLQLQDDFRKALALLKHEDVLEPGNPALCWPVIILACSSACHDDFDFLEELMHSMSQVHDPANAFKLQNARNTLIHFRDGDCGRREHRETHHLASSADLLLKPWLLDRSVHGLVPARMQEGGIQDESASRRRSI
ncbi:hypothetical protein AMS68_002280 [Peltaster fructicola]|uniref:Uncharacterized protein n=1 Tax=Peltaster fructicola TaxID=286661 RepID=A0A6H0XPX8_9PEZI|nr:hypothetical protein AMS68_002280 [Peltaster fructicola]